MITATADQLTLNSGINTLTIVRHADGSLTLDVSREGSGIAILHTDSRERAQIAAFLTAVPVP